MTDLKDGVVLHDKEFVPDRELWAQIQRDVDKVLDLYERERALRAFGEGIAFALTAGDAAFAGNWRRMPCEFCESTDGEMAVYVVATGRKMHAKCARKMSLYREHASLVDRKFTERFDEADEARLAAVREELAALEAEE